MKPPSTAHHPGIAPLEDDELLEVVPLEVVPLEVVPLELVLLEPVPEDEAELAEETLALAEEALELAEAALELAEEALELAEMLAAETLVAEPLLALDPELEAVEPTVELAVEDALTVGALNLWAGSSTSSHPVAARLSSIAAMGSQAGFEARVARIVA